MVRDGASTYVTKQELTGNQCIQPPILHQYSLSFSRRKSAYLAVSLLLVPSLSSFSVFSRCVLVVCLFESHSISILRTSLFLCLPCIQMIRLTGKRMKLWRWVGWWKSRDERWRASLWSWVSPNQISMRWWQLEECTSYSLNTGHMTLGLRYLLEQF